MRWSKYYLNTLKETPKDAEAISHQLMLRAGLIRRLGSGAYSYLPNLFSYAIFDLNSKKSWKEKKKLSFYMDSLWNIIYSSSVNIFLWS